MTSRLLPLLFVLFGCDSKSSPADQPLPDLATLRDLSSAPASASSTAKVAVPTDFQGTPRQLLIAAFDSFPVQGPPAGILYQGTPTLAAGQTLSLMVDASGLSGKKTVLAVLYMEGGGQLQPMAGVDYVSAPTEVTFTGQPLDLGTLTLTRLPGDDGGMP